MKLYRKKLNSLEELRREKIRLRYERRHTDTSDLFPISEIGGSKMSEKAKAGLFGTIIELFSARNDLQTALALSRPVLNMLRKRRSKKAALRAEMGLPKKDSFFKKVALEFLTAYLIGKGVQVGIHAVQLIIKKRKHAKVKAKLHAQL
jgi:hypothetical protein